MSVDQSDFASTVQKQQYGQTTNFWPIVIPDLSNNLGVPVAVNINPCDHIWLPTFYDPSIGLNPAQRQSAGSGNPTALYDGPNSLLGVTVGMNIFDVYDQYNSGYAQSAPIFSLRFNNPGNPWLLWSLSSLLSIDNAYNQPGNGSLLGKGDAMRSISGPISAMWVKLISPATFNNGALISGGSQIVLMSSLGYSQLTAGGEQPRYASSLIDTTYNPTTSAATASAWPQTNAQIASTAVSGGGYTTTQLNTLERIRLERMGLAGVREP